MSKVRIRNIGAIKKKIEKFLVTDLKKKYDEIGEFAADRIQKETWKGKSLVTESKLPSLKKSTKIQRKHRSKMPVNKGGFQPHRFFKPDKSNVTQTGQMIESVKYKINNDGDIEIAPSGSRSKSLGGGDEFSTNRELAADLQKRGFKFLGLDKRGRQRIRQILIREIRRLRLKAGF